MFGYCRKTGIAILLALFNLPVSATYLYQVNEVFFENPFKGISKIAVNIKYLSEDPYHALKDRERITKSSLESEIEQKLNNAGFEVISLDTAESDPDVVYLDLEYHINLLYQLIYTYDMKASVRQKFKLPNGEGAYLTVKTWSEGRVGGTSQSGLGKIRTYTHELVDNFIQAYHAQN